MDYLSRFFPQEDKWKLREGNSRFDSQKEKCTMATLHFLREGGVYNRNNVLPLDVFLIIIHTYIQWFLRPSNKYLRIL